MIHIDSDPLKQNMPVFYIDAVARFKVHPTRCIEALTAYLKENCGNALASDVHARRWKALVEEHNARLSHIGEQALQPSDGTISPAYLMCGLRKTCPADTVWVVEAVTNAITAADQIQAKLPGSWINCGGGGLGWSGGGALGVKLAVDA